jgi:hypothetical protein
MNNYRIRRFEKQIDLYRRWIENNRSVDFIKIIHERWWELFISEGSFVRIGKSEFQKTLDEFGGSFDEFQEFLEKSKLIKNSREMYGCFPVTADFRYKVFQLLDFHDVLVAGMENLISDKSKPNYKKLNHLSVFSDAGAIDDYVDMIREQMVVSTVAFLETYIREAIRLILNDYYHNGIDLNSLLCKCKEFRKKKIKIHNTDDVDKFLNDNSGWRYYKDILANGIGIKTDNIEKFGLTATAVFRFRNLIIHEHGLINNKFASDLSQFKLIVGNRFYPDKLFCGNLISYCECFARQFDKEITVALNLREETKRENQWRFMKHIKLLLLCFKDYLSNAVRTSHSRP